MLTKLLTAASLVGALALSSNPSVAQGVAGQDGSDLYASGTVLPGMGWEDGFRCNFRIYGPGGPSAGISPLFLTCSIPCVDWTCLDGTAPGPGIVRWCLNYRVP